MGGSPKIEDPTLREDLRKYAEILENGVPNGGQKGSKKQENASRKPDEKKTS